MKYRIKTKEEFIRDFGQGWRKVVRYSFTPDMDYLLGQPLESYNPNSLGNLADQWSISKDMVTTDPIIEPNNFRKSRLNHSL